MLNTKFRKILLFLFLYYTSNIILYYIFDLQEVKNATLNAGFQYEETNLFNPGTNLGFSLTFNYYWLKSGLLSSIVLFLILRIKKG